MGEAQVAVQASTVAHLANVALSRCHISRVHSRRRDNRRANVPMMGQTKGEGGGREVGEDEETRQGAIQTRIHPLFQFAPFQEFVQFVAFLPRVDIFKPLFLFSRLGLGFRLGSGNNVGGDVRCAKELGEGGLPVSLSGVPSGFISDPPPFLLAAFFPTHWGFSFRARSNPVFR